MQLVFLHGLETGPYGKKYQALKQMFGAVIAPDCEGIKDPAERLQIIQKRLENEPGPFLVVGSSAGGLMALRLQQVDPRVACMVLCAPAIHTDAAAGLSPEGLPPTIIIHGIYDEVVPIDSSRCFRLPMLEVEDGHRLDNSIPLILLEVFRMKLTHRYGPKTKNVLN